MSTPYLGEIKMFAGNFAPRGFAFCNGQQLPISQNTALFAILGTTYGGNGQTTFGLPNLQGRFPMHWGNGPGLTPRTIGETVGAEQVTLLSTQMPPHIHAFSATAAPLCSGANGNTDTPVGGGPAINPSAENYSSNPTESMKPFNVSGNTSPTGGGQPFSIIPPFQCVSFIIALEGIFPSRS
jgi:microcystin-dependent protein